MGLHQNIHFDTAPTFIRIRFFGMHSFSGKGASFFVKGRTLFEEK